MAPAAAQEGSSLSAAVEGIFARHGARYRWPATAIMMLGTASMVLATTIVDIAIPDIPFRTSHSGHPLPDIPFRTSHSGHHGGVLDLRSGV